MTSSGKPHLPPGFIRASNQGHEEFIRRWWAERGAQCHEVMSGWRFGNRGDLGRALRMEFPPGTVEPGLRRNPERTELSDGYVLHHLRRPA